MVVIKGQEPEVNQVAQLSFAVQVDRTDRSPSFPSLHEPLFELDGSRTGQEIEYRTRFRQNYAAVESQELNGVPIRVEDLSLRTADQLRIFGIGKEAAPPLVARGACWRHSLLLEGRVLHRDR
jgi:hypothetical protein